MLVPENRLKGNFGAAYVAALLSTDCLVRPVAADTDVGIDLYCETVQQRETFLHFWVQVKAGGQCRLAADKKSARCRFERVHLSYWARQPVPVFAALVPTTWPVRSKPLVYIVDLTRYLIESGVPKSKGVSLTSTSMLNPQDQESVLQFLREDVPRSHAILKCRDGVVANVPMQTPQYIQQYPEMPIKKHLHAIYHQIRRTGALALVLMDDSKSLMNANPAQRRVIARAVEAFEDDQHWENFMACGLSNHADGHFDVAAQWYRRAIDCIRRDRKVAHLPEWVETVAHIEKRLARAQKRKPLPY